jgi:dTDP-4-amino-4,6-dideoxygalactose transaminase
MEVLQDRVEQRRKNHARYFSELGNMPGITFLPEPEGSFSNRWLTTILVDPSKTRGGVTRELIRLHLENLNIESRPLWKPMHLQPVFSKYPYYGPGQVASRLFDDGLCLPSGSNLEDSEIQMVINEIKKLF